jgi:hypothetical protein
MLKHWKLADQKTEATLVTDAARKKSAPKPSGAIAKAGCIVISRFGVDNVLAAVHRTWNTPKAPPKARHKLNTGGRDGRGIVSCTRRQHASSELGSCGRFCHRHAGPKQLNQASWKATIGASGTYFGGMLHVACNWHATS